MSLETAHSVLLAVADEQLGLATTGRLAVVALTGAATASGNVAPAEQALEALLSLRSVSANRGRADNATQQPSLLWVQAAAAVVLLRQLSATLAARDEAPSHGVVAGAAVEQLLLPALASLDDYATERRQELVAATAEAVAAFCLWGLAEQVLHACAGGPQQAQAAASAEQQQQQQQLHLPFIQGTLGQMSQEWRMGLAGAVLQEALKAASGTAQQAQHVPLPLLHHAAERTLPAVLQVLAGDPPRLAGSSKAAAQQQQAAAAAARSAALRLLATALQAAFAVQQQGSALHQLWATCK